MAAIKASECESWIYMKVYGLYLGEAAALAVCDVADTTKEMKEAVTKRVAYEYLACLFIRNSDNISVHALKRELANK